MTKAYRGLTIRIGADMSELNKALRSSNAAISETQKQLRQLERLSRLDPESVSLYARKMDVLNDRAQALTSRLMTLRGSSFMGQLATDTEDAALKAKLASAEYAKVDARIAELKTEIVKASGAGGEAEEAFKSAFAEMQQGSARAREEMLRLGASEEQVAEYAALVERHFEALANKKLTAQTADVAKFKTQLAAAEAEARSVYEEMARLKTAHPAVTQTEEFERLRREMARGSAAADELKAELRMLDDALRLDPSDVNAASLKMQNMGEQVRGNVAQLNRLNEQMELLRAKDLDKASAEFKDLKASTAAAQAEVAELSQKLDKAKSRLLELGADTSVDKQSARFKEAQAEVSEYTARLRNAESALERMAGAQAYRNLSAQHAALSAETRALVGSMADAGTASLVTRGSLQQLGWAMYSTVTPAVTMLAYSAVNSAEEVDAAYRDMRKTVQGTEEQFEELRQAAIDFSRTHVTSADQILEIEAMGGQLGIATDKLAAFAETVSNVEIATNIDADTAAEQMGQLQGILNDMTDDDFARFGDALVRLGNNNATLEDKIMDIMLRISSMGTITGFSTTQLLAWSTAAAATGQGAEAAGTAVSKTMSDIEAAVGEGGESLAAFASVAQTSSEEFASAWENDPSGAMQSFILGLKAIEEDGGSADATLGELGITSARQKQTLLGLVQTVDGLNDNLTMSADAWNGVDDQWGEAGDAAREAERKAEGFSGAIQLLRNNIQVFGVEAGESLSPAISALGDLTAAATQAYSDMPEAAKQVVNFGLLGAAALGPVSVAANAIGGAVSDMAKSIASKKSAWAQAVRSAAEANDALWAAVAASSGLSDAAQGTAGSLGGLTRAQRAAALASSALKTGLVAVAAVGVAATVALIAKEVSDAEERATNLRKATDGLRTSMDVTRQSFIDAASAVDGLSYDGAARSIGNVSAAVDEAIAKQAELAGSFTSAWAEVNGSSYALESYLSVIEDLTDGVDDNGNAVKLTAEEQGRLAAAVAGYNEIMGTSVEVTDAQNGKLSESTDALEDNARAWMDDAKAQAAQQQMVELQKQQLENAENLADAQEALSVAQAELDAAYERGDANLSQYSSRVEAAEEDVARATAALEANEDQCLTLAEAYYLANGALSTLAGGLGLTEEEFAEFAAILGVEGDEAVQNFAAAILAGDPAVADAAAVVQEAASGMADGNSWEWGVSLVEEYAAAVADGADDAASAAGHVASEAEEGARDFDTSSIGEDFSSGFASGITSGAGAIVSAARDAVKNAIAAAKREQDSHSPAKKMIEVGGWFSEGYAVGIGDEAGLAAEEASRMVARSVEAARKTIGADGLTVQARAAADVASLDAASRAAAARSAATTVNRSTVNNCYIDGATVNSHEEVERLFYSLMSELKRLGLMEGGR